MTYVTQFQAKPVGDVEGHVTGTFQRRGLCLYATGEVAVYLAEGALDITKGNGTVKGESTCTFEDGSSSTTTWSMKMTALPNGLHVYTEGKGEFVRGTGRFEGIQGTTTFSGKTYTPNKGDTKGDLVMEVEGKYTLPSS